MRSNATKRIKVGQYFQQGDVIIRKVAELPKDATPIPGKVLQESETTGHHHHFLPQAPVSLFQRGTVTDTGVLTITPNLGKYIEVTDDAGAVLYHGKGFEEQPQHSRSGDHESITIPRGIYEIDIVREYDYDRHEIKRVVD